VLVIDDDIGTLFGYKGILRMAGYDVVTSALGEDGIAAARREPFDVVLCDQRLPDILGVEVVRIIHLACPRTSVVLISAWGTPELVLAARENGATGFADKPLIGDDLVRVVDDALRNGPDSTTVNVKPVSGYAERRWADLVVRGIYLPEDPKTIRTWGRNIGLALGTLKKRCEAAGIGAKTSLDTVRLLRIVIRCEGSAWDIQGRLDILDERTARALLQRGITAGTDIVPSVETFLSAQRLIRRPELVTALRERLLRSPFH